MRVAVIGVGAVGARAARQLVSSDDVEVVVLRDLDVERAEAVAERLVERCRVDRSADADPIEADVVVLAGPSEGQAELAAAHLRRGAHVVSLADDPDPVRGLLALDAEATERERSVVVGAGFSPGLSCLLARHAADALDEVDEVHIATVGTAGPSCARSRHRALAHPALDWRDGGWSRAPAGSGRELCWFPDPIGAHDCWRASRPEPLLMVPALPGVRRVTARMAASRREVLSSRLPAIGRRRPDGGPGAVRVEARGRRDGAWVDVVYGVMDRPSVAAGAVAALAARWAGAGRLRRAGAGGVGELMVPLEALHELADRGVRAAVFEGADSV